MTALILATIIIFPFLMEIFARTAPRAPRPKRCKAFYALVPITAFLVYGTLAALFGHPVIALGGLILVYGGLTIISNLKVNILGEPFIAHDFENARHLRIYPEFYVNYVGLGNTIAVFGTFAALIALSYFTEASFVSHQSLLPGPLSWALVLVGWFVAVRILAKLAATWVSEDRMAAMGITMDIPTDAARFGVFPLVLLYLVILSRPSDKRARLEKPLAVKATADRPDIIAIQGESYFDLDRVYGLTGTGNAWPALADLKARGTIGGPLEVPAWGAFTMQTEFSFLSGIKNADLGIDRINPYIRVAQKPVATIASALKAAGYRTVCVHPAKKEFFRRDSVIPLMGFDEFIGLEAFLHAPHYGPYVSDAALGDHIEKLVADHHAKTDQPIFVFTITIESHGPWDKGRLDAFLDEAEVTAKDPTHDREFALYRAHMDHLMALFARLGPDAGAARKRIVTLYGDHQPALMALFEKLGLSDRRVDYLMWATDGIQPPGELAVEDLRTVTLRAAKLL